ncbi:MAG: DUF4178 domain-containing protein [Anaerolineae bacterium]|nr:DUF4178 domain-containing protein [Anaerolineae bacterium]
MQQLTCANCGGPIEIDNQFIRTVTCKFCGSSYLVRGSDNLDPTGKSASLADYPSRLSVGMRGAVRGRGFRVLGRVRYSYDDGFWEEWQVAWDDGAPPDWLEEDEGYWTLYKRERVKSEIPAYDQVRVGSKININNRSVFITEKRRARMIGSEGQFSSVLPLKGDFGYIQGAADGLAASVNYWEDEIELSVGDELEPQDFTVG